MPTQAFYWQLYIATYTALLGIPLLFFPKSVIPSMGLIRAWLMRVRLSD